MTLFALLAERTKRAIPALALAAMALVPSGFELRAETASGAEEAAAFIRGFAERGTQLLADRTREPVTREREFRRLFREGFAIDTISRFVLGRHWRTASAAEREEFRDLFEAYVFITYARHLDRQAGVSLVFGPARLSKAKSATVSSLVLRSEGAPVSVDWRLRRVEGSWRIVDVVIEGVSLAIAQRAQFASVIRGSGGRLAGLLEKLRQVTADGRSPIATRIAGRTSE